jgi:hypothetical protein
VLLWLTIALLLARGAGDLLASERQATRVGAQRADEEAVWPDDAARAFAVEFASVYLHHSLSEGPSEYAQRVGGFASGEIAGELIPRAPGAPGQAVESTTVAGVELVDDRDALITVAALVKTAEEARTRLLVVPVARDEDRGLLFYDLPRSRPCLRPAAWRRLSHSRCSMPTATRSRTCSHGSSVPT